MSDHHPLSSFCEFIVDCEHKTAPLSARGYPSIRTPNVGRGRLILEGVNRVDEETFQAWTRRAVPRANDLIVAREAPVGNVAIVPADTQVCLGQRTVLVRPDPTKINPAYLCYFLLGDYAQSRFRATTSGATVGHLNMNHIRNLRMPPLPALSEQSRTASILSAYDDLMEVNRRKIAVLEAMARGLFEEWFVSFRYPGHESLKIVDTPNGPLPEGWEWGTARDLIEFDPRTKVPADGEKPFIPMGCLDTSTSLISEVEVRAGNSGSKFQNGDTLFARITPCLENGKTGIARDLRSNVGFGSTEFIVMRAARAGSAFAYCLARLDQFRRNAEAGMSGASGRQRAPTAKVASFEMGLPPRNSDIFDRFEAAAWPMLTLVGELGKANATLANARDLLLPRLVSGDRCVAAERGLEDPA